MAGETEFEGRTEQEAVQKACVAFAVREAQLDYTVVDAGSGGLFGLGSRPVRIRARAAEGATESGGAAAPAEPPAPAPSSATAMGPADEPRAPQVRAGDDEVGDEDGVPGGIVGPAPEKAAQALDVATALAVKMGMEAKISIRDEEREIVVVIEEADAKRDVAEMLGGSRPRGVPSFQFLLNKIVNRFPEGRKHVVVEAASVARSTGERRAGGGAGGLGAQGQRRGKQGSTGEGRERGAAKPGAARAGGGRAVPMEDVDPELAALGRELAARAIELGKVITVHPMGASDRRAVHLTIVGLEGVETVSEGEGLYRRMHIVPASLREQGGKKRRRRRRRRRREDGPGAAVSVERPAAEAGGAEEAGGGAPDAADGGAPASGTTTEQ